jgi:soluble P-type ATPase
MIVVDVPGHERLRLRYLVLDYNGTLALDGRLLPGVTGALRRLHRSLDIHVLTADTFGTAAAQLRGVPATVNILPASRQDVRKAAYVRRLGAAAAVCVGNGRNDRAMLRTAALGITVLGGEGAATETMLAGSVVCPDILSALHLLLHPGRLVATLRR